MISNEAITKSVPTPLVLGAGLLHENEKPVALDTTGTVDGKDGEQPRAEAPALPAHRFCTDVPVKLIMGAFNEGHVRSCSFSLNLNSTLQS